MAKAPAFPFVVEALFQLDPIVKPMFGCHAVYVGEKIVLILRQHKDHQESNGVWIATSAEHHKSLKEEFPSMQSIPVLSDGKGETNWQMIPGSADDFEESVLRVCDYILARDVRIGRIPKARKKKIKV